jgi:hypothetical protein
MFTSINIDQVSMHKQYADRAKQQVYNEQIAKQVLPPPTVLKQKEVINSLIKATEKAASTAKRRLKCLLA